MYAKKLIKLNNIYILRIESKNINAYLFIIILKNKYYYSRVNI
jgi:hypothetical protein